MCGAGGCFAAGSTFRQTWSASDRAGPVSIGALLLDRGVLGANQDMLFKVSFRLADGTKVGDWGTFMIAGLGGEEVRLGGQAFTWDTSQGDLILQLELMVPDKGGAGGFFGGGGGGGGAFASIGGGGFGGSSMSVAENPPFSLSGTMPMNDVLTGLPHGGRNILGFDPAIAVPEPSAWALMVLGFGSAGALLRTRRRTLRYG